MKRYSKLSLIDANPARRADRAKVLAESRFEITMFSTVMEFCNHGDEQTLIFLHDEGREVETLLLDMRQRHRWSAMLAYGDTADPVVISKMILSGLVSYLPTDFLLSDFEGLLVDMAEQITTLIDLRHGSEAAKRKLQVLTVRELEILNQLQYGSSSLEIGQDLGISVRTVEQHRYNILRKLKLNNGIDAIRLQIFSTIT